MKDCCKKTIEEIRSEVYTRARAYNKLFDSGLIPIDDIFTLLDKLGDER